ncbi:MAG: response regulator [Bacteroidota bacterium]|nr:response regulator [Bacteroidota bacterium]
MKPITPFQESQSPDIINMKNIIMPDQKDITIFLVDDDAMYLKSLEFQFRQNPNLKIETFLTGEACIEKLFLKPDVIILDYILSTPNKITLTGPQTLVKIKKILPSTQVIMLSAMESAEVATNSIKLGAFDYVIKDHNTFPRLKACVKKILGIFSKEKELIVWDW